MENLHLELVGNAIPWDMIQEVITYLKYGTASSIMFKTLVYTGCRISELSNMTPKNILNGYIIWKTGKNQTGYRKEKMPESWLDELKAYRSNNNCPINQLFHKRGQTFVDEFNKQIRSKLSPKWTWKRIHPVKDKFHAEYVFQIKGLRKNFQTIKFNKYYKKYKDAGVALEFISKEMKHSSKHMTAYHYIENCDILEIEKYRDLEIETILNTKKNQTSILEFLKQDSPLIS